MSTKANSGGGMATNRQRSDSISIEVEAPRTSLTTRLLVGFTMGCVRSITLLYELISWPLYSLFSSGEAITDHKGEILALPVGRLKVQSDGTTVDDYSSPWRSVEVLNSELADTPFPGCSNLPDLLNRSVKLWPTKPVLGRRKPIKIEWEVQSNGKKFKKLTQGAYEWFTFSQIDHMARNICSGFLNHLKLVRDPNHTEFSDRVLIFAETRLEWQLVSQSCFRIGLPLVTLYATLGDEAVVAGVLETEVRCIVTSDELLPKLVKLLPQMPLVEFVVFMRSDDADSLPGDDFVMPKLDAGSKVTLISVSQLEKFGEEALKKGKEHCVEIVPPKSEDLAIIMYTSGSTGMPKGVEMTHGNVVAAMAGMSSRMPSLSSRDCYIGYLPLAHILELSCENLLLSFGVPIGFGSALTLVDSGSKVARGNKGDVRELRPTLMACVPTILDRVHKTVMEQINAAGPLFVELFKWALEFRRRRLEHGFPSLLMHRFVFRRVRRILGGRIRVMISGGAPLNESAQEFINNSFCRLIQGYGLTETCAAGTIGSLKNLRSGHVGAPIKSVEIRLKPWVEGGYSPDDKPRPRGEIIIGGPCVSRGYFKQPEKTKEDFYVDDKGQRWFCTGDIGVFHADGTLSIIDRKKDLVKLQMGEYISLGKVELALSDCPLVEQICVYGDSLEQFVVALVVPKRRQLLDLARKVFQASTDADERGKTIFGIAAAGSAAGDAPGSEASAENGGKHAEISAEDYEYICHHPKVCRAAIKMLDLTANQKSLSRIEAPRSVFLDPKLWTPDNGLLTAAMKLKRRFIQETFQEQIDRMYNRPGSSAT